MENPFSLTLYNYIHSIHKPKYMITKEFIITFLSDWHCSSGLGAGAETDNEVIKDKDGLPYIPGKTIKGLLRDAMEEIREVKEDFFEVDINQIFGNRTENEKAETMPGNLIVSNATLKAGEKNAIKDQALTDFLYRHVASTAIKEQGIAKDKSLRVTEVCVPLQLTGRIDMSADYTDDVAKAMKWIRRLGSNRNRGYGRCIIKFKNESK